MADPVERTEMRRKIMTGSLNPTQRRTILPFENCSKRMIPGTQMYLKVKGVFFLQVDTDRKAVTKLKNLYSYLCKSFSITFDLCDYSHHTCSSLNPTSFEISEILENEGGERKREREIGSLTMPKERSYASVHDFTPARSPTTMAISR